ncbi:MAG: hypothetical protein JST50_06860 [Bacteroidetes bacterium]|jgi:hypothetical protein|nr:hypothetical protein [Bacteroidota bacterium]
MDSTQNAKKGFWKGLADFYYGVEPANANSIKIIYHNMLILVGVVTIIIFTTFSFYYKTSTLFDVFTALAVTGAVYLGGCAMGFLFAIPKSVQGKPVPVANAQASDKNDDYNDNTSLEEISDWLTKIIVGLSLTQFNQILDRIDQAAIKISEALKHPGNDLYVFSYGLIVFYFIAGLTIGYMWTRIDFRKILTKSKKDLETIKKLQKENSSLKERKEEFIDLINNPKQDLTFSDLKQTDELDDPNLQDEIATIVRQTQTKHPDDLHKEKWGGKSYSNMRQLTVEVSPTLISDLFKVRITVSCVDDKTFRGPVAILLHDTFKPMIRILNASKKQTVFLEILSYEAFTVAALSDIEQKDSTIDYINLELDINDLPNLPKSFYWSD